MELNKYIDTQRENIINSLTGIIKIPSVKREPCENMPFGKPVADALGYAENLANDLGLSFTNYDNYAGIAEYGEGEQTLGVLAHLDVVPEGSGWSVPPYEGVIKDGSMIGRGVCDNKGPAIISLYALAAIKKLGIPLKKKVQVILGCDEESGWADIDYLSKKIRMPDVAFSPDAEYPVVNAEKAILHVSIEKQIGCDMVLRIDAGTRANVVAPFAHAAVKCSFSAAHAAAIKIGAATKTEITVKQTDEGVGIEVTGSGAHASKPQEGNNAITALIELLAELSCPVFQELAKIFPHNDYTGKYSGIACADKQSGELTQNIGLLSCTGGKLSMTLDCRCPVTSDTNHILGNLAQTLGEYSVSAVYCSPAHFVSEDSPLIKSLLKVYAEQSGKKPFCFAIGGGTYARAIKNAVSFGCTFPGQDCREHMSDEIISLDDLLLNAKIIANAIVEVANCGE